MIKQVILVRKDLDIPAGKLAAQVAHASVNALLNGMSPEKEYDFSIDLDEWMLTGYTKICLGVDNLKELEEIKQKVDELKLINSDIIIDEGRTCFSEPTATCLGIGPVDSKLIDTITRKLKLY